MPEDSRKRAYAVVEGEGNNRWLRIEPAISYALLTAGFAPGDEVEIRLRVAQGEDEQRVERDLLLRAMCEKKAERVRDPEHGEMGIRIGNTFYPLEALESPISKELHDGLIKVLTTKVRCEAKLPAKGGASKWCGNYMPCQAHPGAPEGPRCLALVWDAALVNREPCDKPLPCGHHPQGPQALPEEVVCYDLDDIAHQKNVGHRCRDSRPAHPPAARTEPSLADLVAETRASIATAAPVSAAPVGVCEKWNAVRPNLMGSARRCGLPLPCAKHPADPVAPAPKMAQHDPPGSCAFTSSGVCVNHPDPAPHAPSATPEPEKLGEVKREVAAYDRDARLTDASIDALIARCRAADLTTDRECAGIPARALHSILMEAKAARAAPTTKVGE